MTPYRHMDTTPPVAPSFAWSRRLAATWWPARWRSGRAAKGGHWHGFGPSVSPVIGYVRDECVHCVGFHRDPKDPACRYDLEMPCAWCEDHGPSVPPLRLRMSFRTVIGRVRWLSVACHALAFALNVSTRRFTAAALMAIAVVVYLAWWSAIDSREVSNDLPS